MKIKTEILFDIGLVIKGIDSLFEVVGGALLLSPLKVGGYVEILSQHSRRDFVSRFLEHLASGIKAATIATAIYLIVHGLAKLILIIAALKRKAWGYIALMIVLAVFSIAELSRYIQTLKIPLLIFALFDAALVLLIAHEYQVRHKYKAPKETTRGAVDSEHASPSA